MRTSVGLLIGMLAGVGTLHFVHPKPFDALVIGHHRSSQRESFQDLDLHAGGAVRRPERQGVRPQQRQAKAVLEMGAKRNHLADLGVWKLHRSRRQMSRGCKHEHAPARLEPGETSVHGAVTVTWLLGPVTVSSSPRTGSGGTSST